MKLIFLGPPGAGKGTQSIKIASHYNITHISTGDIFRSAVSEGTQLGNEAKSYMDKGELVPDNVVIGIIVERLKRNDVKTGFVLDGFPRTIQQAKVLDEELGSNGINAVVELTVSDKELISRISGRRVCKNCGKNYHVKFDPPKNDALCDDCSGDVFQREDDKVDTVKKRIDVYKNQTSPLSEYYKNNNRLVQINGEREVNIIQKDIINQLNNLKNQS